ncbi:aminoacylase-1 [Cucumis melo var. makuwa]|uniref:Beta-amylase n=1 Tax=Cucumis melo var. makuwa TaxID=1194695 RepID=A0A5A7V3X3_CUCMM|nr:aminoacylase-1 [Cucumis melo var. makuwa]
MLVIFQSQGVVISYWLLDDLNKTLSLNTYISISLMLLGLFCSRKDMMKFLKPKFLSSKVEEALDHEWFREVPLPKSKEFMPTFPAQHARDRKSIGLGPFGELRYPAHPFADGRGMFPQICEFHCYDKYIHSQYADDESDQDSPVSRFQRYLIIKTAHPDPDYASVVAFLISQAQEIGLHTQVLEFGPGKPLLLVTWYGSNPSLPSVLLNSHMDSVPFEPSKWLHPPFSAVRTSDGKIFARGSQDDM